MEKIGLTPLSVGVSYKTNFLFDIILPFSESYVWILNNSSIFGR